MNVPALTLATISFLLFVIAAVAHIRANRCKLFGHRPSIGCRRGKDREEAEGYLELERGIIDGTGIEHVRLFSNCACCGARFKVGNLHVRQDGRLFE